MFLSFVAHFHPPPSFLTGDLGLSANCELTLIRLPPRRLVSASEDGTARLFELHSGRPLAVLGGHQGGVVSVSLSEDGQRALTMTATRQIAMYDTRTGDAWKG